MDSEDSRIPAPGSAIRDRALGVIATTALLALLYFARDVLVPITLAFILSLLIAPLVRGLRRFGLTQVWAVLAAVVMVAASCGAVATVIGSPDWSAGTNDVKSLSASEMISESKPVSFGGPLDTKTISARTATMTPWTSKLTPQDGSQTSQSGAVRSNRAKNRRARPRARPSVRDGAHRGSQPARPR